MELPEMIKLNNSINTFILTGVVLVFWATQIVAEENFQKQRHALINIIKADVVMTREFLDKEILQEQVLDAMRKVPRHEFVPEELRPSAYRNKPLPIGYGQTISQPYIVAIMTDLLELDQDSKVLEIGTGSGYQAAVLAELSQSVFTIEIIEDLAREAAQRLGRLGYTNVQARTGDGYYGWEAEAPFDAIMVTAAASYIPPPLIKQLKPGGRMIIPVGDRFMVQQLVLVTKDQDHKVTTRQLLPVAFVPLTGQH